jgi:hypothetical protein
LAKKILYFGNSYVLALREITDRLLCGCLTACLLLFIEGFLDMLPNCPKNRLKVLPCSGNELGQVCQPSEIRICAGVLGVRDRIKNRLEEAHS